MHVGVLRIGMALDGVWSYFLVQHRNALEPVFVVDVKVWVVRPAFLGDRARLSVKLPVQLHTDGDLRPNKPHPQSDVSNTIILSE